MVPSEAPAHTTSVHPTVHSMGSGQLTYTVSTRKHPLSSVVVTSYVPSPFKHTRPDNSNPSSVKVPPPMGLPTGLNTVTLRSPVPPTSNESGMTMDASASPKHEFWLPMLGMASMGSGATTVNRVVSMQP